MRKLVPAACFLFASGTSFAQDVGYRNVIIPMTESENTNSALIARALQYGAPPIDRPYLDDAYRVYRLPSDDANALEQSILQYYKGDGVLRPYNVVNYQEMIAPREAPRFGRVRERLDELEQSYGTDNVEYGVSLQPDLYESAPLEGDERITIAAFDQSFIVGHTIEPGMVQLETPGGESAVLHRRRSAGGLQGASATIIQGDDAIDIMPVEPGGPAIFIRRRGAAAAPDHIEMSSVEAERLRAAQERRELAATPDAEMPTRVGPPPPGCAVGSNTIVLGWAATPNAWHGIQNANELATELAPLRNAFREHGISVDMKVVRIFDGGVRWVGDAQVIASANNATTGGAYSNPSTPSPSVLSTQALWRAANNACADVLILFTDVSLTGSADDCGRARTFAGPRTAALAVNIRCMFGTRFTLAHELGHIFGACHEEAHDHDCPSGEGPTYAPRYAWVGDISGVLHGDLMAIWNTDLNTFRRNEYFSQPDKFGPGALPQMSAAALVRCRYQRVAQFYEIRTENAPNSPIKCS